jgi:hypothetical protein
MMTLTSSENPSNFGDLVTFTATVYGNLTTPIGTVTFFDGPTQIGFGSLSSGTATFSTASLSVGYHAIAAVYGSSAALTQVVNQAGSLGLSVTVTGVGTITSSPAGIYCGAACTAAFSSGTQVTLNETPANGWVFTGWSGACTGTGSCVVTMNATQSVMATFTQQYTLSVSIAGDGTVTGSPSSGISCHPNCNANYISGTPVTLTPLPAQGWNFSAWTGACSGTGGCSVTMNSAQSVSATFVSSVGSQIGRTFVSAKSGSDTNPCTRALPCRTFVAALGLTTSGGEIQVLDPGGYGPLAITGPLAILGVPGAGISVPANATGITINAGATDQIIIKNLDITGTGAANSWGIAVTSGSLTLQNSTLKQLDTGLLVVNSNVNLFHVDIISNQLGVGAFNAGPTLGVSGSGATMVLLFSGSSFNNAIAYDMINPGADTPNILEFLPDSGGVYSTQMAGNGTLVTGSGAGCPCTSLGTFNGATNPN